jgi:3-hydroxymyristoyl/3-hydroxydecanoyl-(acyl carrier protein) dehydratase
LKKIRSEIEQLMQVSVAADGERIATFCFPEDFSGFQGHFPGKAILPGACQLQCFLTFLKQQAGQALVLKEIKLVKYLLPVFPDETITCTMSRLPEAITGSFVAKGAIFRGAERVTEIRLLVAPGSN